MNDKAAGKQEPVAKPTPLEKWRKAEQVYADSVWAILNAEGAPLPKKAHRQLKDLRYAADDLQRKYYRSLRKA